MGGHAARTYWEDRGLVLLWTAVLLAPLAVAVNEFAGYVLVKPVCASGAKLLLTTLSAAALAVTAGGAWLGWSCLRRLRDARQDGGGREDRSLFMATVAIGFNALAALLVLVMAMPHFVLGPCE